MKRIAATRQDRFLFKRRLISVAVMSAVSGHAGANPTGPQVVNGQASFATQAGTLTVTNSPNAIVNWQSFSIGSNETTRFVQQSAASAVLNRVVGVDPSRILGTLQSNGKVFLVNTNGILFGQGARIDVAGLVASTLNLNDADFLAGRLNFESSPLNSSVVNRGTIVTPEGGSVFLVGAAVENSGIIHAPGGQVILAAGQTVRLGSTGAPNVLVEVEAPANRAVNLGELAVGAGKAGIYGGFVEQKGIVSANTATVNAAGKIVFKATRDTTLAATSVTSANGGKGGTISVESGGTSFIEGVVSATGASGKGGSIDLLGKQVGVIGGASVDASGATGGGTIRVGGDYKGGNPEVANARATFLGADTRLRADATKAGDGGRVIVWSDEVTRAYGDISVRGGPAGGNGGFVETSSRGFLDVLNAPDLSAPLGRGGAWLLDPYNITVVAALVGSGSLDLLAPNFLGNGDDSTVSNEAIQNALNAGGVVIVDTGGAGTGTQDGNITVDAPITMTGSGAATLEFRAANDIYLTGNAAITSFTGSLSVLLNSDRDAAGGGAVWLQPGSSITTNTGNLTIGGGADPLTTPARASATVSAGVRIEGATIETADGDISIQGAGPTTGVSIIEGGGFQAFVTASTGNIAITSTQGDLVVDGGTSFATVRALAGDVVMSSAGSIDFNNSGVTAGRNIELRTDNFLDTVTTFDTGTLDSNYFRWAPWTPGTNLNLSVLDASNVLAPRVQLGVPGTTDTFGTVTITAGAEPSNFSAVTKSFEVYAHQVDIDAFIGATTPLPLSLTVQAIGDINVGANAGATVHLGDGRSLALFADADGDGFGNLTIGRAADAYVDIRVGDPGSTTASSMELRGRDILFQGSQNVWLYGPGTQTIAAEQDVLLSIAGPDNFYLSVGSEGLTALTAGGDLVIQSTGDGVAQIAGDFSSPAGVGGVNISVSGDVRMVNAASQNSGVYIQAQKGMSISANSLQLVGAAGGQAVGINNSQGLQSITTTGSGPNGWGIELTNNGSLDSFGNGVNINSNGSQEITANDGGILLDAVGHRVGIYASAQEIATSGDIVLVGGVADFQVWSDISASTGQTITARSLSIINNDGPSSTGIFAQDGLQQISTTGSAGNGYGITIRNLGASGTDQNGFGASAYIYDRAGTQIIDVADSNGILMEGVGGDVFLGTDGLSQTITIHGSGANRLDLTGGLGNAVVSFNNGTAQSISAGAITLAGGTADRAAAIIVAHQGTQTIDVAGTLSLTGGSAPGPSIPDLNNPPTDCTAVSACAVVAAHGDLQTINAGAVSITGGSDGTENLATIRGDAGQDITVGSGGLTMQGGGGPGLRNYAFIENFSGDQILRFTAGAPLTLTGGTTGSKHFAGIQAFTGTTSQQILGNPVITLTGGASGGGDGTGFFATFKGNNAAIVTEPGSAASQIINAQSIDMQGGGGIDNNAHIGVWGTGASQTITVAGDVRMHGGTASGTHADIVASGDQAVSARSIQMTGSAGGATAALYTQGGDQDITTTGSGANGWGIELVNNGAPGQDVYIQSSGSQRIEASNGGGILLDAAGGNVTIRGALYWDVDGPQSSGTQVIDIDGTGANKLELRGGAGGALIEGTNQSIRAGIAQPGSILLQGGTENFGGAWIFSQVGTQSISTPGELKLVAGSAPDNNQGMYECGLGGACALILAFERNSETSTLLQHISASQIIIQGGSGGAYNEAAIFSEGNQLATATGSGGILVQGGAGTGNYATLSSGGTYAQEIQFGSGDLRVIGGTFGGRSYADVTSGGGQTIIGTGNIVIAGGVPVSAGSPAKFHRPGDPLADAAGYVTDENVWSYAIISANSSGDPTTTQFIVANSIFIDALPSQSSTGIWLPTGVQSISTTGAGADGYGLTVRNSGAAGGPEQGGFANAAAFITTNGRQAINVQNSRGLRILGDGGLAIINAGQLEGAVNLPAVAQTISVHGTGANEVLLDASGGRASIYAYLAPGPDATQFVQAGLPGEAGSISVVGGTSSGARADITAETGTQAVWTTGEIALIAGSAPDAGQGMYQCTVAGACAQILALETGSDPGPLLQNVRAGSIVIQGGSGGAYNSAELWSNGSQGVTITGAGGILIQGGTGTGNFARIGMNGGAGYSQTIGLGAGDLRVLGGTSGGQSYGVIVSQGNQSISGAGNITVAGGVLPDDGAPAKFYDPSNPNADPDGFVFDPVVWSYGMVLGNMSGDPLGWQTITANSITIDALPSQSSTGIFALDGVQTISTVGAGPDGYGLTIRNSGAIGGPDQGGFSDPTAFVAIRYGRQVIDVTNSGGLHIAGEGGWAGIWNGEIALDPPARGVAQSITVHGTGINAILLEGGAGQATIFGNFTDSSASQTIVAGLPGEAGSISVRGGTADMSGAWITAETGTQTIRTTGALTLIGGATPSTPGTIDFSELDCLPACASVLAKVGHQTIEAGSIVLQGGASGNENLASIRGNAGQDITIRNAGGLQILGGGGLDNDSAFSDFAMIENYAGAQIIRFLTPGAPLTIDAGDKGMRHFAGIYNAGTDGGGQQILGDPAISIRGGTGGSGAGSPDRFQLTGNFAFIASESGPQQIAATSIDLIGGGGDANIADLANWGGALPGSALGSQTINVINALTLQGGTGTGAYARIYSYSDVQRVDVGGALTVRRAGAGEAFLGNMFDLAVDNLGFNAIILSAGTLSLEGGHIWGDDGVVLSIANSGSVSGGSIHAGRTSAPTSDGGVVVEAPAVLEVHGSLSMSGTLANQGLSALFGTTLHAGGVSNEGTLLLWNAAADVPTSVVLSGGQFINTGTVQSLTEGGASANTVQADFVNQGLVDAVHSLTIYNSGVVFDTSAGALQVASGEKLTVNAGTVRMGPGTGLGTGSGVLDLGPATVELTGDLTIPVDGAQLQARGAIRPAAGVAAVTLANAGTLELRGASLDAGVTLANQGTLAAASDVQVDANGTLYYGSSSVISGTLTTATGSTIRIEPGSTLTVANGFVNNGSIELQRTSSVYAGADRDFSALLTVSAGTLTNAGTILSTSVGAGTAINQLNLNGGYNGAGELPFDFTVLTGAGTLQVDAPLQVNHYYGTVDLSAATVNVPLGQTLSLYSSGSGLPYYDGKVVLGGANLGASEGALELQGSNVLELSSNLRVNDPEGGVTLSLSGSNTVNAATGNETLTNLGTLELAHDTINAPLVNEGELRLRNSTIGGTVDAPSTVNNQGTLVAASDVVADASGTYYYSSASTINGTLTTGSSSIIQVEPAFRLVIANGFVNNGSIELQRASTVYAGSDYDFGASLVVMSGKLTNAGSIHSTGAGRATAINSLDFGAYNTQGTLPFDFTVLDGTGTLQVDAPLQVYHYGIVDLSAATVALAAGQTLSFYSYGANLPYYDGKVMLGGDNLGASRGTLELQGNNVLELSSDLTNDPAGGVTLSLTGYNTVNAATAEETLTNLGALELTHDAINAPLINQGEVRLRYSTIGGTAAAPSTVDNQGALIAASDIQVDADGTYYYGTTSTINGELSTGASSTIRIEPGSSLYVANGFANNGSIELQRTSTVWGGSDYDFAAYLTVSSGKLTNAGTLLSTGTGRPTAVNRLDLNGGYNSAGELPFDFTALDGTGTLRVNAPLLVYHYYGTVDLSTATVDLPQEQTLSFYSYGSSLPYGDGKVVLGGDNLNVSESRGRLELQGNNVLELSSDLVNDPAGGVTLSLSGSNTVNAASGVEMLTNLGTLELASDTINAPLVNQGTLNLRSSTLGGTTGAPSTVDNQGTLVAASDVQVDTNGTYYYGSASTINGTLTTGSASTIRVEPGSSLYVANGFVNNGLMELERTSTVYGGDNYDFVAGLTVSTGTLSNAGNLRSTGTGAAGAINQLNLNGGYNSLGDLPFDFAVLNGAGTLQVDAPLQVSHYYGTVDLGAATVVVPAGQTLSFYSGGSGLPHYDGKVIVGGVNLGGSRGTLELQGSNVLELSSDLANDPAGGVTLSLSGSNTVNAASGEETLTNLGTLELASDTINAPLVNQGTLNLRYSTLGGTVTTPSTVDNQGTLVAASDVQSDANGTWYYGSTSTINGTLTTGNPSTIRIEPGSSLYLANGFTNNGLIELERTSTVYATSPYDFTATLTVSTGALTNAGSLVSTGAGAATAINRLNLNGGYNASGTLPFDFTVLTGAGTLQVDAPLQVNHYYGTVDLSGATVEVPAGQILSFYSIGSGPPYYDGKVIVGGANLGTSRGTLELQGSNVLELSSDLANDPAGGVTLSLSGSNTVTAAAGEVTLRNLGTLDLTGDTINAPLVNQGTLNLRSSTLGGTVTTPSTVDNQGTLVVASDLVADANGSYYSGTSSTINGTLTTATGSTIQVEPGSSLYVANGLTNSGSIELERAATVYGGSDYEFAASLTVSTGALTNAGTILSTGVGAAISAVNASLDNQGLLDAQQSLNINGAVATNIGTVNVASGATLAFSAGLDNQADGVVSGTGTIAVGVAGFTNSGTIAPGASPGTLTIDGDLTLTPSSVLEAELEGTGAGEYDVVDVTGTAALDGTLRVLFPGVYQGGKDDSFQVLTASAVSGTFASVISPPDVSVATTYDTTAVVLNLGDVLNRWIAGSGLWTVGTNWSRGVPTGSQDAIIEVASSLETITIPTGSDLSVGSLTLNGEVLQVIDSRLEIVSFAALDLAAVLDLTNSSIVGTGGLSNQGRIELSSGSSIAIAVNNSGTIRSQSGGGSERNRIQNDVISTGQIDATHDLTITGALTIPNTATGVVITGDGDLAVGGALTISATGGPMTVGGTGTLTTNAASAVNGGQLLLDTRAWRNFGAMTIGGRLTLDNGAALTNEAGATLTLGGTNGIPIAQGTGALATVSNAGTLTKTSTADQTIVTAFDNSGTVDVNAGTLDLAAGGTHSGSFAVNGADTELEFVGGTHTLDGAAFSGPGLVRVNGATLDVNASTDVASLFVLQTGVITGAGDLTLNGPFRLAGGTISGTGVLFTNGATTVNNAAARLDGRTWENSGTMVINGRIRLANGATLTNQTAGSIDIASGNTDDQPLLWDGTGALPTLRNRGTVMKNAGVNQQLNVAVDNTDTGTLSVNTAGLSVDNFTGGANAGAIDIAAGATLSTNGSSLVNASTGTIDVTGSLDLGEGNLTNDGALNITGGDLATTGSLAIAGTATLQAGLLSVGTLSNTGTLVASGGSLNAGSTDNASGGSIAISGATVAFGPLTNAGSAKLESGTLSVGVVTNRGTLDLDGGTFTRPDNAIFSNAGTVNLSTGTLSLAGGDGGVGGGDYAVAAGATLQFSAGSYAVGSIGGAGSSEINGANVTAADVSVDTGGQLRFLGGELSSTGALSNAGSVVASGGVLNVGSVDNQSGGGFTINGATVTAGPFTNAATATLQSGSLSVGTVANSGTLNLNGGTFTRDPATTFGNSGTVNLNFGTLSLGGGEGSLSGGNYAVGSGATLRFSAGSYHVGSLGGAGSSEIDGGDVTAAAVSVASGGQLRVLSGALSSTGALSNAGTVAASGGSLNAGSVNNQSSGGLTIDGATVTTGPFTNAGAATLQSGSLSVGALTNTGTLAANGGTLGATSITNQSGGFTINGATVTTDPFTNAGTATATLQSGSLSVGTVANSGTLNLNGGTFTRDPATTFGNSGTVNLNFGTLALAGGEGSSSGGNYTVGSGATLRFSGDSYHVGSLGGAGSSEIDGGNVTAAAVSVASGGQLRVLSGALSSTGALSNAGTVAASGGSLNAGSVNNQSGGDLTINGATVTAGPFTNAGTATLQSGSLSVGALTNTGTLAANGGSLGATRITNQTGAGLTINGGTVTAGPFTNAGTATLQSGSLSVGVVANSGTLNLNSGTFTRSATTIFGNSGTVNLNFGTLSLAGGEGSSSGGNYAVGSGATLRFSGGSYHVGSLGGAGSSEINGGDVTATAVSVATGGQLRMLAGALSSSGALSNSGSVVASGGLLNAGSIDNQTSGGLTINGATVTTVGPFTNAGTATLQSGSLSVAEVTNRGTLNLNGGTFTQTANATFGNSGTVNLNKGTLSLEGGDGGVGGGIYNVASGTTLAFSDGQYGVSSLAGGGSVQIVGVHSPAKLYWNGTMSIKVEKLTVTAVGSSAEIDPPDLTLDVPGGVRLTGGSSSNAYALIAGDNVSLTTSTINLTGGAGSMSYAGIRVLDGSGSIVATGGIDMVAGTGPSSGAWMTATGPLTVKTVRCNGCTTLGDDPFGTSQAGLWGNPVDLQLPPRNTEVPSSVLAGVQTAQGGGEGDAELKEEEDKDKQQSSDRTKEEQNNEKPLQACGM